MLARHNFLLLFLLQTLGSFAQIGLDTLSFNSAIKDLKIPISLVAIGEAHEVKSTYITEFFLLKELVKKGYNNILIEGGMSEAAILNEYLKTGDEKLLQYTRAKGKHYQVFIKKIKQLKAAHPSLHFTGIDFERSICLEHLFTKWLKAVDHPNLLQPIEKLQSIKAATKPKKIKKILLAIKANYAKYETDFRAVLGTKATILKQIIFNPVFYADFNISSKKRDAGIQTNLMAISPAILNQSIVIFGNNHFTNPNYFWANFIAEHQLAANSVLFLFAYKNCTNWIKNEKYSSSNPLLEFVAVETSTTPLIKFELMETQLAALQNSGTTILVKLLNQ